MKGKGVGREEEEGKNIVIIIWSFIYIDICLYLYTQFYIFWTMFGKIQDFLDLQLKCHVD